MLNNLTALYILVILNIIISFLFLIIKFAQNAIIAYSAITYCKILKFIGLFFTFPFLIIIGIIGKDYLYGQLIKNEFIYARYDVKITSSFLQELIDPYQRLSIYTLLLFSLFISLMMLIYHHYKVNALYAKIDRSSTYPLSLFKLLKQVKQQLNIHAKIDICRSSYIQKPCLLQLEYPTIIIPNHQYSEKQLINLIEHELYHFKQHDLFYIKLANFFKIIYWYNPIVIAYANTLLFSCELAIDEKMTSDMSKQDKLDLIKLMNYCLKNLPSSQQFNVISFSDHKKHNIVKRVEFIINFKRHQRYRLICTALLSLTIILAPLASYQLTKTIFELLPSKVTFEEIIDVNDFTL
ncbi:MAG: hypothetical protein MR210_07410 [Erysipelotrichaceae bacterium]|nr:hypothetical protein [Erysipelotrichaceae bacterium]MDY5251114.1 M56 family metallopeptidase [Erysipelotrichaceae bacterium]